MKKAGITVIMIAIAYGILVLLAVCKPADDFSITERRKLTQKPELTWENIQNGNYMTGFEKYATDQFPFRDTFRSVKALFSTSILQNTDTNGIYYKDGYLAQMEYPMDEESIKRATDIFSRINDNYFVGTDVKPYLCVIPDKNYVLAENEYLSMDYEKFAQVVEKEVSFAKTVSIMEDIQLSDFYKTDTHWRQEEITDIAWKLGKAMDTPLSGKYEAIKIDAPFYGVYYGQRALPIAPDSITYCSNQVLERCSVFDHENGKEIPLYDLSKTEGRDPYELFLGGNVSLVTIENTNALSKKELVVFGDSFSRSMVPLLAEGYAKTTLVDIRYLPSRSVGNYITFTNQDVLFLYSTSVLNNSITLK